MQLRWTKTLSSGFAVLSVVAALPAAAEVIEFSKMAGFRALASGDEGKAVVVFTAEWCNPCAVLVEAAENMASSSPIDLILVDVEAHPEIAEAHGIGSIPTSLLFVDGSPHDQMVGLRYDALRGFFEP